jgi:hypothetical protein
MAGARRIPAHVGRRIAHLCISDGLSPLAITYSFSFCPIAAATAGISGIS